MTTILKSLQELALHFGLKPVEKLPAQPSKRSAPSTVAANTSSGNDLRPEVSPSVPFLAKFGQIYWLTNRTMDFGDRSHEGKHPAVVVDVVVEMAIVCPMTSKIQPKSGLIYNPEPQVRLKGRGSTILTKPSLRKEVPLVELIEWVGLMGPEWQQRLKTELETRDQASSGPKPALRQKARA